ncbi:unnamed protein product [Closterium sp. NIES-54]
MGARSGGTRAGGAGGASSRDARPGDTSSRGAGAGGASSEETGAGGASSEETRAGGTATVAPTPPPHRYPMSFQRLRQLEREERERLEQERLLLERQQQEQQHQQQQQQPLPLQPLFPPVSGLRALGVPSSPPDHSLSPPAYSPTFPPPPGPFSGSLLSSSITVVSSCCPARLDSALSRSCTSLVSF